MPPAAIPLRALRESRLDSPLHALCSMHKQLGPLGVTWPLRKNTAFSQQTSVPFAKHRDSLSVAFALLLATHHSTWEICHSIFSSVLSLSSAAKSFQSSKIKSASADAEPADASTSLQSSRRPVLRYRGPLSPRITLPMPHGMLSQPANAVSVTIWRGGLSTTRDSDSGCGKRDAHQTGRSVGAPVPAGNRLERQHVPVIRHEPCQVANHVD